MKHYLLFLLSAVSALAYSVTGSPGSAEYTTDGSQADVEAAITASVAGDTVRIPAGSFTWGASSNVVPLTNAITLKGAGPASTTIVISNTAPQYGSGTIQISGGATVRDFTVQQTGPNPTTAFSTSGTTGWRITNIVYESSNPSAGYFVYDTVAGVIDSCTINTYDGEDEPIFGRWSVSYWASPADYGSVNATYVEDNTFNGPGYPDANTAARRVMRFNTIVSNSKFDGHGLASNSPARGVRLSEWYNNTWTNASTSFTAMELRGGTGMIFNNTGLNGGGIKLTDYGYTGLWSNFGSVYMTPTNYPVGDQIGTGQDITVGATSITAGKMYRIVTVGTTSFTSIGAANNNVGTQFIATGTGTGTGTVTTAPAAAEPVYIWGNTINGAPAAAIAVTIPAGAITQYGSSFTIDDVIQENRDFFASSGFKSTYTFNGTGGIGTGTAAQMLTYSPTKVGVGFWVTDEGSWNTFLPANTSGRLYRWDGSAWVLYYTPYTYPHPLRGTVSAETTPPTPNPVTWASAPIATAYNTIVGTASNVTDALSNPCSYSFSVVPTGQPTSWGAWQSTGALLRVDLTGSTTYDVRVKARDAVGNETTQSGITTVTTPPTPSATKHRTFGRRALTIQ